MAWVLVAVVPDIGALIWVEVFAEAGVSILDNAFADAGAWVWVEDFADAGAWVSSGIILCLFPGTPSNICKSIKTPAETRTSAPPMTHHFRDARLAVSPAASCIKAERESSEGMTL